MTKLLDLLQGFNRKERFFLFTQAADNPQFLLGAQFREDLARATGVAVPADARAYVDYHLDWLHAAVFLSTTDESGPWVNSAGVANEFLVSTGNQEDIDLLVAFAEGSSTRLILVEAKADTGWTNAQMRSKTRKLKAVFGHDPVPGDAPVQPTFCLASPRRPSPRLDATDWPSWMLTTGPDGIARPAWLQLRVPAGRKRVEGCDAQGKASNARTHWQVRDVPAFDVVSE